MADRHSETTVASLIADEADRARVEARNALRQYDAGIALLRLWIGAGKPTLRPSDLLTLNRYALEGVHPLPGTYRPGEVTITGSVHQPPSAIDVPAEVEDFCDYINGHWGDRSAIHLAAYALWRINWIHPFSDGNGRTARILSYMLLCAKVGYELPGLATIPDQIVSNKEPYYKALESADALFARRRVDVSSMERLLEGLLASQLLSVHETATQGEARMGSAVEASEREAKPLKIEIEFLNKTAKSSESGNFLERNPVLFNGLFALAAAIVGVVLTLIGTRLF